MQWLKVADSSEVRTAAPRLSLPSEHVGLPQACFQSFIKPICLLGLCSPEGLPGEVGSLTRMSVKTVDDSQDLSSQGFIQKAKQDWPDLVLNRRL